jgi:hypothetical protein
MTQIVGQSHLYGSRNAWQRLLEIAAAHFPDAYGDFWTLYLSDAVLTCYPNHAGTGYRFVCPAMAPFEAKRKAEGRLSMKPALAALATDLQEFEIDEGKRYARMAASGGTAISVAYARSMQEGFGYAAFDDAYAELTTEHQRYAAKKRRRRLRFGLPVKALRGRAKRKAERYAQLRQGPPDSPL